jgi:hypothetical protein
MLGEHEHHVLAGSGTRPVHRDGLDSPRWRIIDHMWTRWLALAATTWTGAYVVAYLALVRHDGNSPAWWYIGLIAIGMVALIVVVAGWLSRPALVVSAVCLGLRRCSGCCRSGSRCCRRSCA